MRTVAAICLELTRPADRRTDGELLAAFVAGPCDAAFAELVRRHGALVWGACRRLLPDPADAEDAFQAAFLVLVRRAARLARGAALGPWLYRVAVWTARNVRRKNARRRARQSALPDHLPAPPAPDTTVRLDLDAALLALPARYRDAVVLCHLAGLSRAEAAAHLGCPEGTLSARLSRGLAKLRARLGAFDPARVASVAVPALLIATTARAAVAATVAAATVPPAVTALAEGVLHMFWVKKATAAVFALCAVFALGVGTGFGTRTDRAAAGAQEKASEPQPKAAPRDFDKEIKELETAMKASAAGLAFRREELRLAENLVAKLNGVKGGGPEHKLEVLRAAQALEKAAADVATAVERFHAQAEKLARLKVEKSAAEGKPVEPKDQIAALEKQILKLDLIHKLQEVTLVKEEAKLKHLRDINADAKDQSLAAIAVSEAQIALRATVAELDVLNLQLAFLKRKRDNNGYIELTITGTAGKFSYVLYEVPHDDGKERGTVRKFGPVTTTDTDMLAKLLTRAKADATAPRAIRVIAQPQTSLGVGPRAALKACATAGYDTVTFTGYVVAGGFTPELKPDAKGEKPGYIWHDAKERKPAELVKEIEEGMKRF
ncbi:MAG: sigma-70 family RNA polymerase sigma factor [Planctomycetes bacterium]|nr:sigma-70 family RNA polymerase sigma factor [Planctomycetota bacterium]